MMVSQEIQFETPRSSDGMALNRLVSACPPLDGNSAYCNILQCDHLSDTCLCARRGDEMVGFVSGYLVPSRPTTLFIWQVAVSESARGTGLATRMLLALLEREACKDVWQIETTITASNTASQALFERLAATLTAPVAILEGYDKENHFDGIHETEHLWRIGPIPKIQTRLLI